MTLLAALLMLCVSFSMNAERWVCTTSSDVDENIGVCTTPRPDGFGNECLIQQWNPAYFHCNGMFFEKS